MALIDEDTLRVEGYFEETKLPRIRVNDKATIRLIGEISDLTGHVDSIAGGIEDRERSAGSNLLANVNPTFSWVRLAQRIPVRIVLDPLPDGVSLISGRTATVAIAASDAPPSPLDWLRQWLPRGRSPDADQESGGLPNAVANPHGTSATP
jgi:multidrug resistance efflux pump